MTSSWLSYDWLTDWLTGIMTYWLTSWMQLTWQSATVLKVLNCLSWPWLMVCAVSALALFVVKLSWIFVLKYIDLDWITIEKLDREALLVADPPRCNSVFYKCLRYLLLFGHSGAIKTAESDHPHLINHVQRCLYSSPWLHPGLLKTIVGS